MKTENLFNPTLPKKQPVASPKVAMSGVYAVGVFCHHPHSGNRRFAKTANGYFECAGCGNLVSADSIAKEQFGEKGMK